MNHASDSTVVLMVKATFVGASETVESSTDGQVQYVCNFFIGDSTRWRTHVPNFSEITYHDLYPGIDLKYYGNGSALEYDFIVRPGADLSEIKIKFDGATSLEISSDGELLIGTMWGEFKQRRPQAALASENGSRTVDVYYEYLDDDMIGLATNVTIGDNDLLIVDPILEFSTVVGGGSIEYGLAGSFDDNGNIYIGGMTSSIDFPLQSGFEEQYGNGNAAMIMKLDGQTYEPVFSTYIQHDWQTFGPAWVQDIDIQSSGDIYLLTGSSSFVSHIGLMNSEGDSVQFFKDFLSEGSRGYNYPKMTAGEDGHIYVTGCAISRGIWTDDPFMDSTYLWDMGWHGFLAKVNIATSQWDYIRHFGGDRWDECSAIAYDPISGDVAVAGSTNSPDYLTTFDYSVNPDAHDDAFIVRFDRDGNEVFSARYGGTSSEYWVNGILFDDESNIIFSGLTFSQDLPLVNSSTSISSGGIFVASLSVTGDSLLFSQTMSENPHYGMVCGIGLDENNNIVIGGQAYIDGFPLHNPILTPNGTSGPFHLVLNGQNRKLQSSSFLFENGNCQIRDMYVGDNNRSLFVGFTFENDPIVTHAPIGPLGDGDAFVAVVHSCCLETADIDNNGEIDIIDLVSLIDLVYIKNDESDCLQRGDINGDGSLTITDFVYLVDYLFRSGTTPVQCN